MKIFRNVLLILFLVLGNFIFSQTQNDINGLKNNSKKLEKAIEDKNEPEQAAVYVKIAENYHRQNNFAKTEEFLTKAKAIYEKLDDKENLAMVIRKIAQSQENQNQFKKAKENYSVASKIGNNSSEKKVNANDYNRLESNSIPEKERAIKQNMELNETKKDKDELAQDYQNMAEINVQQGKISSATQNLDNAYSLAVKQPEKAVAINQKAVDILVNANEFDKAIATKKKVLSEDFVQQDSKTKAKQIQELAAIYLKSNDKAEAEKLYENSYKISIEKHHTLEAQKAVLILDSLYKTDQNVSKSILLYKDFLAKLPLLLQKDNSLLASKMTAETEQRIAQLEKEKLLQDELIRKKNNFNYGLLIFTLLLLALVGFILFTLKKLRIKNKKIALQSLRREMNPHFIFNSLNSVNQFIAENNELEANQYLTKFSKLMRGVMENSNEDFIPFQEELDLLQNYLALEKIRFQDKFSYQVTVDPQIKITELKIPGMLLQPFLENAIWHGLRYKSSEGFLKLDFKEKNKRLVIQIEDNGIGLSESKRQKTDHQKQRKGRGMKNTLERMSLLNDLYGKNIQCNVVDKENGAGVLVFLEMNK